MDAAHFNQFLTIWSEHGLVEQTLANDPHNLSDDWQVLRMKLMTYNQVVIKTVLLVICFCSLDLRL